MSSRSGEIRTWEVQVMGCSEDGIFKWGVQEMGNSGVMEVTRCRLQEIGGSRDRGLGFGCLADCVFRKCGVCDIGNSGKGEFMRWLIQEIGVQGMWNSREKFRRKLPNS